MPRRIICRKFFLYMGLLLILLAASIVGIYFYTLNRYAEQIAGLLDLLLAEELSDGELPANPENSKRNPQEVDNPGELPAEDGQSAGSKSPGNEPPLHWGASAGESPAGERKEPGPSSPPAVPAVPAVPNESLISSELPAELAELEQKIPLLRKVELKDRIFALQMVKKFSAAELQEMYCLYSAGGASRSLLKKKLAEKITPAEMDRIRTIAAKYRGLL